MRLRLLNSLETLPKWWGFVVLGGWVLAVSFPISPIKCPQVDRHNRATHQTKDCYAIERGLRFARQFYIMGCAVSLEFGHFS
jgi:hypothetical protein